MLGERFRSRALFGGLILFGLLLGGCATTLASGDEEYDSGVRDPFETVNRLIFAVNLAADAIIIRPAAEFYRFAVPAPGRAAVRNFMRNLSSPVILANDLFQGEFGRAGTTTKRFFLNTTIGLGGLLDVATGMGHEYHDEDFGQTLGSYRIGGGIYLVLPVLGPSNLRDAFGTGVDFFLDPLNTWARNTDRDAIPLGRTAAEGLDFRARNIETIDELQKSSLDFYAAVRSLYKQTRDSAIRNGAPIPLPDISYHGPRRQPGELVVTRSTAAE